VEFDAISIRPHGPEAVRPSVTANPTRLTIYNTSLSGLIKLAYDLRDWQLARPAWLDSTRFDITATTTTPASREDLLKLLQPVLASRFKLTTHRGNKVVPVFKLVASKSGPKFKSSEFHTSLMMRPRGAGALEITGRSSLSEFADLVGTQAGRPAVDQTGLTGNFDLKLRYAPELPGLAPSMSGAPSLFAALQQQLGLRLVPGKLPLDVMVVDHAERSPSEN
jgi:uncharacterized protein (TIGR03435 family)